ncbi:MAG TPA: asparagine--tRNA ligase [Chitinophagales bacterium]|nr:asparagine--tRNA ligase [Chitinophagales bacterium]HNE45623.1 asparagine--tRNA ligase [Chitinophagales bacterium]HNI54913.1 asparagine--tRNA ligase [Chitinophagales bacterium]HNJ88925.1 asparagine--tRNA ligase [Chitinophagales bacterium]HNK96727.1 asparagine--tRNA ligase [Chitinophagales bacterium]
MAIEQFQYIRSLQAYEGREVTIKGWVSNKRDSKGLVFLIMRDGSGFAQCVVDAAKVSEEQFEAAKRLTMESSVCLTGTVVKDERQVGGYEIQVSAVEIIQIAQEYPIAKKEHGVEFLVENRHLWLRSRKQWAMMRVRNRVIFAIHSFFQQNDFLQMDAPIFTGNACEGTSTLFETDFYGRPAYLSQSGQLYGEALAMAHGKIYTFGPTFRAEKSKTRRHLSEFWMIEPEMAFYNLDMNMDLIEQFLKYVVDDVITHCASELETLERNTAFLRNAVTQKFPRIHYDDAVAMIRGEKEVDGKNSIKLLEADLEGIKLRIAEIAKEIAEREAKIEGGSLKQGEINFNKNKIDTLKNESKELEERASNIPQWLESARNFQHGNDFGGSDETVLTRLFSCPIMVYNWPAAVKAFYMKRDPNDPRYVKGVDVLAPEGYGEIVGGAEREDNYEMLLERIQHEQLPVEAFDWYLDLRKYGTVPHAGFGLGLERMVMWISGGQHIREAIPFPRFYGRLEP